VSASLAVNLLCRAPVPPKEAERRTLYNTLYDSISDNGNLQSKDAYEAKRVLFPSSL
jgi:hypothetical protein